MVDDMTVAELIEKLAEYPPTAKIVAVYHDGDEGQDGYATRVYRDGQDVAIGCFEGDND